MLCVFNVIILVGFGLLALISSPTILSWVLFFGATPLFLVVFLLWFSQEVLHVYKRMSLHQVLLVTKIGLFPFLFLLLASCVALVAVANQPVSWQWQLFAYNTLLLSVACLLIGACALLFGLRHHFKHLFS